MLKWGEPQRQFDRPLLAPTWLPFKQNQARLTITLGPTAGDPYPTPHVTAIWQSQGVVQAKLRQTAEPPPTYGIQLPGGKGVDIFPHVKACVARSRGGLEAAFVLSDYNLGIDLELRTDDEQALLKTVRSLRLASPATMPPSTMWFFHRYPRAYPDWRPIREVLPKPDFPALLPQAPLLEGRRVLGWYADQGDPLRSPRNSFHVRLEKSQGPNSLTSVAIDEYRRWSPKWRFEDWAPGRSMRIAGASKAALLTDDQVEGPPFYVLSLEKPRVWVQLQGYQLEDMLTLAHSLEAAEQAPAHSTGRGER